MIMNGARAHHHNQTVILALQYPGNVGSAAFHQSQTVVGYRQPFLQDGGSDQGSNGPNAGVINPGGIECGQRTGDGMGVQSHVHYYRPRTTFYESIMLLPHIEYESVAIVFNNNDINEISIGRA
jgi:hypothetical protein